MPVQPTHVPARSASGQPSAASEARLLSAVATLRGALAPDVAREPSTVVDRAALLDLLSVLSTTTPTPVTTAAVVAPGALSVLRPPRWNFAGYCQMCGDRGCQAADCITAWSTSTWVTCPTCDGHGVDRASSLPCSCYAGLVEADDEGEPVYYVADIADPGDPLVIDMRGRGRLATLDGGL